MLIQQNIRTKYVSSFKVSLFFITKRAIDIIVSLTLIIVLAPLMLILSWRITKKEGKPVFFRQVRVGKYNRRFVIWRFRTMTNPSKVIHAFPPHPFPESWSHGVPDSFHFNRDPHTFFTKTGMGLRKYHVDKLPQFFNVLKGDMSLVGPKPEIPEIAQHYNYQQKQRLHMKPGMTGLAQINQHTNTNHREKIMDDLTYIEDHSFRMDMKIMWRTVVKSPKRKTTKIRVNNDRNHSSGEQKEKRL